MFRYINKTTVGTFLILLFLTTLYKYGLFSYFSLDNIESIKNLILSYGVFAPLVFIVLYCGISLVGVSAAFMTILAGLIFGNTKGLLIVVIGATLAAYLAFLTARFFSKKFKNKEGKITNRTIKKFHDKVCEYYNKSGFTGLVILRLLFLPYIPLSYACGLIDNIKTKDFVLSTLITNVFGSFIFIFLGSSLTKNWYVFALAVLLVILVSQTPKLIKKFNKN